MKQNKHFERILPKDYVCVQHVDAKTDKKQMIVYTVLSLVPPVLLIPLLLLLANRAESPRLMDGVTELQGTIAYFAAMAVFMLYIVLHEITHGVTYKAFTGAKLTFGLTPTVAFCGVPNIYVRRRASISALVMPFAVFSVLFLGLTAGLWTLHPLYGVLAGSVFALHLGGYVGDLHWTLLYLTKFKGCNTLMRDTGPEQWLYVPKAEAQARGLAILPLGKGR